MPVVSRIIVWLGLVSLAGLLAFAGGAHAAAPTAVPILRVETGMHTTMVRRLAYDAPRNRLITAADDKTIRVWQLPEISLVATLRVPLDVGHEGQMFGLAVSPDGRFVAAGGWTGWDWEQRGSVYVFDMASGEMVRRLGGFANAIGSLRWTADGQHLVVGLQGKSGLVVVRASDGAQVAADTQYADKIMEIDISRDGRLVTASLDGMLRLYSPRFKLIGRRAVAGGRVMTGIRFSPDGSQIAVGFADAAVVTVVSSRDLSSVFQPDTGALRGLINFTSVAWSSDGDFVHAAGDFTGAGQTPLVRWGNGGRGQPELLPVANNRITELHALDRGAVVFATEDPSLGIVDARRKLIAFRGPEIVDFSGAQQGLLVSDDAGVVAYPLQGDGSRMQAFAPAAATDQSLNAPPSAPVHRPLAEAPGVQITDWKNSRIPKVNGQIVQMLDHEMARSYAIAPRHDSVLFGTEWALRLVDLQARQIWAVSLPSVAWAVNIARNGQLAVAAFSDGTIRWYRMRDGREVFAYFPHVKGEAWIGWVPDGYYMSAANGDRYIGWHLNQGMDKAARFIPNSQLYDVFYRPDIVQASFKGEDISGLVTLTVEQALKAPPPEVVLTRVPAASSAGKERVCYTIASTGGGIGEVRLFQNSKLVKSDGFYREAVARREDRLNLASVTPDAVTRSLRALKLKHAELPNLPAANKGDRVEECQIIEPIAGENELGVVAFNAQNTVQSSVAMARFISSRPVEEPRLYVLAIGIDEFADKSANLKYAGKDARDFLELVQRKTGALFKPDHVHLSGLASAQATKQGILARIDELSGRIRAGDTFILFIASHGVLLGNQYYLVASGYNGTADGNNLIGSNEVVELSKRIKALSQLYVFDTCHAGGVDTIIGGLYDARMSVLAKKMGLHIYAAAGGFEEALDGYQGNGLFTHALIQSLSSGRATDANGDGKISVIELGGAARELTSRISSKIGHRQTPTMIHFGKDVALAGQ